MDKNNVFRRFPEVGDYVVKTANGFRFLSCLADKSVVDGIETPGVVYWHRGRKVGIVGGDNDTNNKWSEVAWWEIDTFPSDTADCEAKLQNVVVGNFRYTKTSGTIEEFVEQLNGWLKTNAPDWEAYMFDGKGRLQLNKYDKNEETTTLGGCTMTKRIGIEIEEYDSYSIRNQILQKSNYNGICRARLEEYVKGNKDTNCNPTSEMDGTTKLFATFPCSEAYYNGGLGGSLRKRFATYGEYLDACMTRPFELDNNAMAARSGKTLCERLKDTKVLVQGEEKPAYPAVNWAINYDTGIDGFRKGDWWLPSLSELAQLMRDITYRTKFPLDAVNTAISKRDGWRQIDPTLYRWASVRCSRNLAWNAFSIGMTDHNYFYNRFRCSAVSAFEI